MGQFWRNRLFLQAFHGGRSRGGIFGKSLLISNASVLYRVCKTPESNKSPSRLHQSSRAVSPSSRAGVAGNGPRDAGRPGRQLSSRLHQSPPAGPQPQLRRLPVTQHQPAGPAAAVWRPVLARLGAGSRWRGVGAGGLRGGAGGCAAGLTDHVWTLRAVLRFRVPPWPQPAGV